MLYCAMPMLIIFGLGQEMSDYSSSSIKGAIGWPGTWMPSSRNACSFECWKNALDIGSIPDRSMAINCIWFWNFWFLARKIAASANFWSDSADSNWTCASALPSSLRSETQAEGHRYFPFHRQDHQILIWVFLVSTCVFLRFLCFIYRNFWEFPNND